MKKMWFFYVSFRILSPNYTRLRSHHSILFQGYSNNWHPDSALCILGLPYNLKPAIKLYIWLHHFAAWKVMSILRCSLHQFFMLLGLALFLLYIFMEKLFNYSKRYNVERKYPLTTLPHPLCSLSKNDPC